MKKPKKKTTMKENSGKLLLDLGKLVFGSIFLGGVLRGEIPQNRLLIAGFIGASIFCIIGLLFVTKKIDDDEAKNVPENRSE